MSKSLFVGDTLRCVDGVFAVIGKAMNGGMMGVSRTHGKPIVRLFNDDATTASGEPHMQVIDHVVPN